MRSNLVHSASQTLNNRFLLCRMASLAARRMHSYKGTTLRAFNKGLTHIAGLPKDPVANAATALAWKKLFPCKLLPSVVY